MQEDEKITFDQIKKQGIKTSKIIITKITDKSKVLLEIEDSEKEQKLIEENIDTIFLFGVRSNPEAGGPFFFAIIEEGILNVYEEILYKISEEKGSKNMKIYVPIW